MRGRIRGYYYFDPGVTYVIDISNLSTNCDFTGPPADRVMIIKAYATNDGITPIQWREVPILVPPIPAGQTLIGRWDYEIPFGEPRTPLDQRFLKFDMHANWYVLWLEWRGVRVSDETWVPHS